MNAGFRGIKMPEEKAMQPRKKYRVIQWPTGNIVGALRITVAGLRGGKLALRFRANWYCTSY
jgi:hypothetical protein